MAINIKEKKFGCYFLYPFTTYPFIQIKPNVHIIYQNSDPNFQINLKIHQKYHKHANQKQEKHKKNNLGLLIL